MPDFSYTAISSSGTPLSGRMEARDDTAVVAWLRSQGHLPVSVAPAAAAPAGGGGLFGRGADKAGEADLVVMTRELVLLLKAGQPLERCLALLAGGLAPERLRPRLVRVLEKVRGGAGLADALARVGGFPPLYRALVRAGEGAGALDQTLQQLADLLERQRQLKQAVTSALIYPAVLGMVAVGSVLLMLLHVVPQFAPLFANSRVELPAMTSLVLGLSAWMRAWGDVALLGGLLGLLGLSWLARREALAPWRDRTLLRLPLLGGLLAMAATARLARTLSVLLGAGTPLPNALDLAGAVAGNRAMADAVAAMRAGVRQGRGLAPSLPPGHPMPDLAVELLKVGEESGRLTQVLAYLAEVYEAKLDMAIKRFLSLLEPVLVLTMAVLVGGIVVSILMALVSINDIPI